MLTAEIKVNGELIAHIHIVNESLLENNKSRYRYEIYEPREEVRDGRIDHFRVDGALELIRLILEKEKK